MLLLAPTAFKDKVSIPSTTPTLDFGAEYTQNFEIRVKNARDLQPGKPALFTILNGDVNEQAKVDLLTLSVDLLGQLAEMYKPSPRYTHPFWTCLSKHKLTSCHEVFRSVIEMMSGRKV